MEDNKDHIGAAVRALPSDLTEREQIDLLCHVETYMSITDKHSQTAPEAMAEETRMYSLVNGLIAKRFSNIGAAVRGEAVAEPKTIGELFASVGGWMNGGELGYPSFGSMEALKIYTQRAVRAAISSRAADAPSEPSETISLDDLSALLPGPYYMDPPDGGSVHVMEQLRRMAEDAAKWRGRATDALDSQPTELPPLPESDWTLAGSANNRDAYTADQMREYGRQCASSQPTDGGVRNG